jgi:hypothetical protein
MKKKKKNWNSIESFSVWLLYNISQIDMDSLFFVSI